MVEKFVKKVSFEPGIGEFRLLSLC